MDKKYTIDEITLELVYTAACECGGDHNIEYYSTWVKDFQLHDNFNINCFKELIIESNLDVCRVNYFKYDQEHSIKHIGNEYTIDGTILTTDAIKVIIGILLDACAYRFGECSHKKDKREMKEYLDGRTLLEYFNDTIKKEFSLHFIQSELCFSVVDLSYWEEGLVGEIERFKDSKEVLGYGDGSYYSDIITALITFIRVFIAIKHGGNKAELAEFLSN